jgi:hypothetical protein
MIALFSFHGDFSTNKIIDWLINFNLKFVRVNLEDESPKNLTLFYDGKCLNIKLLLSNGNELDMSQIGHCIFRGGLFRTNDLNFERSILPNNLTSMHLNLEIKTLIDFFYTEIHSKSISSPKSYKVNKLIALKNAISVGLKVPSFIVATTKSEVTNFFLDQKVLITKALNETVSFENGSYYFYAPVDTVNINEIENSFFPSLFQEQIIKKFEIRSFFLDDHCYSLLIKSNNIDFRNSYDEIEFERFHLKKTIKSKCLKLMRRLDLNTGSIDFIVDDKDNVFFLEINPIGQFDWVSVIGGYNLYHEMAQYLKNKNEIAKK